MNRFFYGKLAFSNLRKNGRLYLPYIIAAIGVGAIYYIMMAITGDKGINEMPGSADLRIILALGCGVIVIFAVIFLFYTNSFLMKRRKKEFGLFNILGMEKRHIGKMMFWETCIVAFISIFGAVAAGIILYKLVVLVLLRIVDFEVPFRFEISVSAAAGVVVCFLCIFAATLLYNLFQVQKAKPIELLRSSSQGESEPKTKWLMTVFGLLALGGGYGIAIVVKDPMGVILLFFVAVILVILGTYCLFTAGSVAVLKMLRKNKKYYYRTKHFTAVSGMIYRMKQNAVGLANICILSTMVLVMISGTVSLYIGMEDIIEKRYPRDISITAYDNIPEEQKKALQEMFFQAAQESGIEVEEIKSYSALALTVNKEGEEMQTVPVDTAAVPPGLCIVQVMTLEEYNTLTGEQRELTEDEIFVSVRRGETKDSEYKFGDKTLRIKEYLKGVTLEGLDQNVLYDGYFIVVKDEGVLEAINHMQQEAYKENASTKDYYMYADISGSREQENVCLGRFLELIQNYNQNQGEEGTIVTRVTSKAEGRENFLILCGGFLFLGVFLGFVFLMATVLIIYYKQISEGYEDKPKFEIMQKVGMSPKEVKSSIHSQVIMVFFLPLVMACIHLAAAFPMMNRLILLFGMYNPLLFVICTGITVGIFAGIYGIVYGLTAKAYYRIVGEQR
ncbi:MAG: ABC transporter permease [Lachnospiraceae bacterium]|nr:ABC transporter permease [Lachnospiraceae bacterium]